MPRAPKKKAIDSVAKKLPEVKGSFDVIKALKLRLEKHLSFEEIGKIVGVSRQAVSERLETLGDIVKDPQLVTAFRKNEPKIIDGLRHSVVKALSLGLEDAEKVKKTSLRDLAVVYGVLIDKARLIRGESTQNISQIEAMIFAVHRTKETEMTETRAGKQPIDITPESPELPA